MNNRVLLADMVWTANDFKRKKRLKHTIIKRINNGVLKYFQVLRHKEEHERRKLAVTVTIHVKTYWSNIVAHLNKKRALDRHLTYSVDQGEYFISQEAPKLVTNNSRNSAGAVDDEVESSIKEGDEEAFELEELEELANLYQMHNGDIYADNLKDEQEEASRILENAKTIADQFKEAQPQGFTYATQAVKTQIPHLLRGTLREYQHIGLDWLVSLYDNNLNGILADEMGLGKTIETIALLAYLACEREIWGPHLIVVPTSVLVNWEMELKRWLPAMKVLGYYGTQVERKRKRRGWSDSDFVNVVVTSYQLVLQDRCVFRRKPWHYLILDEAQHIRNFLSQRWQVLMSFNFQRRLLLTGTPLQNNIIELWSLMHFIMPHVFHSQNEWSSHSIEQAVDRGGTEEQKTIEDLHCVLRPFLLRRLKKDVTKQLPDKFEHVVECPLSGRQRKLYDDFISKSSEMCDLDSGNHLKMMNLLMQLRKVCNHPDLFGGRAIRSSFDMMDPVHFVVPSIAAYALATDREIPLPLLTLCGAGNNIVPCPQSTMVDELGADPLTTLNRRVQDEISTNGKLWALTEHEDLMSRRRRNALISCRRCCDAPVYDDGLLRLVSVRLLVSDVHGEAANPRAYLEFTNGVRDAVRLPAWRAEDMRSTIIRFMCVIPRARARSLTMHCLHPPPTSVVERTRRRHAMAAAVVLSNATNIYFPLYVRMQLYFPDKHSIQYDCGKLQKLAVLLRRLKAGGHRVLIFSQMTKMLDILEAFLKLHSHTYLRLDGRTKVETRARLIERYNNDDRIFVFILSTRAGGLGINLSGADTVVFYDSDWNPALDLQAQDRVGQARELHVYRLIVPGTIEERIFRRESNRKRETNIGEGKFFGGLDMEELLC